MKECSQCHKEKPDVEFRWKNKAKGIRQRTCTLCSRAAGKKHYQQNKNSVKKKTTERTRFYKQTIRTWKKTLCCCACGEDAYYCLDFHHLDPKEKDLTISTLIANSSINRMLEEIQKCLVVCSNCHRKIHHGDVHISEEMIKKNKQMLKAVKFQHSYTAPVV